MPAIASRLCYIHWKLLQIINYSRRNRMQLAPLQEESPLTLVKMIGLWSCQLVLLLNLTIESAKIKNNMVMYDVF